MKDLNEKALIVGEYIAQCAKIFIVTRCKEREVFVLIHNSISYNSNFGGKIMCSGGQNMSDLIKNAFLICFLCYSGIFSTWFYIEPLFLELSWGVLFLFFPY